MADNLDTLNPFDQYDPDKSGTLPAAEEDQDNPFAQYGPKPVAGGSSAAGAFGRGAERGALPALGGLAAAGAGAELGAAAGAFGGPAAPITVPAGALIGGIGGALGGGYLVSKAQDWLLSKAPDSWREAIGQDERQQTLDEQQHPYASFLGGLAPYALTMRPGAVSKVALPENATALQRIMANPVTARVFGGAAMGGMELGQEAAAGQSPDWTKTAIATGFGLVFNKPTRFGEAITEIGARPARGLVSHETPVATAPPAEPPPEIAPTLAQAGDLKVMGPGITEAVFHGSHEQSESAALTAQDAARTEQVVTGTPELPAHDVHEVVRQMHPELFEQYDALAARRDTFRRWIEEFHNPPEEAFGDLAAQKASLEEQLAAVPTSGAGRNLPEARRLRAQIRDIDAQVQRLNDRRTAFTEGRAEETPELTAARQQLLATDFEMRDLAPQVSAAYRRAADAIGSRTVPVPVPEVTAEPQPAAEPAAAEPPIVQFRRDAEAINASLPDVQEGFTRLWRGNRPGEVGATSFTNDLPGIALPFRKAYVGHLSYVDVPTTDLARFENKAGVAPGAEFNLPADLAAAAQRVEMPSASAPPPQQTRRSIAEQKAIIGNDVARQLIAAGRPEEEATAAGHLIAERYATRAARFKGALGTAEELYAQDGAKIRGIGSDASTNTQAKAAGPTLPEDPTRQELADFLKSGGKVSAKVLAQSARGKIRLSPDARPVITLMKDANASTFIHETGHQWLEELMRDAEHPAAPDVVKDDATTVRDWLGVDSADDIKTRHHEKFARGFEQYMREGVAPSPGLAGVFQKFKNWLTTIYQTLKGLGKEISPDIRDVFDRMIATEPQRTVIAPERPGGPTLADIHEADAAEVEPHEAESAADRVAAERVRYIQEPPPEIEHEIAPVVAEVEAASQAEGRSEPGAGAEPGAEAGGGAGGPTEVVDRGGDGGTEPPSGGVGEGRGAERGGGGEAKAEGPSVPGATERRGTAEGAGSPLSPNPATLFGSRESPFVDKAGNIRLENLTSREDVAKAIRDAAEENDDFIGDRRGTVTDGQVMDLADALGMDAAQISQRKIGQAFNAEQIIAARKLLIQSATDVSETMKRAAVGTDEDVMAYAMAKDRHQMIQGQVAGITAEAGRALRAFRSIAGQEEAQGIDQFLRSTTAKTLFQLREEAKLGAQLDSPAKVSKFLADAQKRTFGRMILEYWVNGLISGPMTHATYAVGNQALAMMKAVPETAAAALVGSIRAGLTGGGERVRLGETWAQMKARTAALPAALEASLEALRSGQTTLLPGEQARPQIPFQGDKGLGPIAKNTTNEHVTWSELASSAFGMARGLRDGIVSGAELIRAGGIEGAPTVGLSYSPLGYIPDVAVRGVPVLPVGTALRLPGRAVAAIHSFFRTANYSMEKAAVAFRTAANEGLTGNAFDRRVAEIRQNPSEEVMEQARHGATELTLMGKGSEFVQAMSRLTNTNIFGFPYLKFVDPFVHIAGSIIDQSIVRRTPLGLLAPELRADVMGKNGPIAQDQAIGRMLVGTALGVTFGGLAAQGLASGSGPSDPHEAAMWRLAGNQAHSVRIGDFWYDTHRLGPLGMLGSVAADLYEVGHKIGNEDASDVAHAVMHAFTHTILDESFMRGPSDLIKALEDPDRYGGSYVRNFLSSFVPFSVGMAQFARRSDPYSRQARTLMDAVKNKIPGLSQELFARRDVWGEPMPHLEGVGMTSIYASQVSHDPVNQAMLDIGVFPAPVQRKIRNVDLTDQEFDDFSRIAGRMTKMRLDAIVRSPDYQAWPNHTRHDVIDETVRQSRNSAREVMMMKYPHIPRDAADAKIKEARGE